MKPIDFPESNLILRAPDGAEAQIDPLPAYRAGGQYISCWSLTWRERLSGLFFGRVWVQVLTNGGGFPPIGLTAARTIFAHSKKAGGKNE